MMDDAATIPSHPHRICHLVQDVSFGGVESLLTDLVAETTPTFDHHVCYLSEHDEGAQQLRDAGATVTKLSIPYDSPRSVFDPRSYLPIVRYLREHDIDVIHTHYPLYVHLLGRFAAPIAGVDRVVGTYHNPRSDFHPVMQTMELGTRVLSDATVGVSSEVEESFDRWISRVLPSYSPSGPVYNGVRVDSFSTQVDDVNAAAVRTKLGLSEDALVFVSVGRYDVQKRQTDIVRAMTEVVRERPDAHLLLVGHGPLEAKLNRVVADEGLDEHVTVTGRVPSVPEYYAVGDVFVSSSAYEGFGIVFVEAMAAGLPVVATAVPGASEVVVDGRTGVLVPPGSPQALASAMLEFQDPERRNRFGNHGFRRAASEFDISTVVEAHNELYRGEPAVGGVPS